MFALAASMHPPSSMLSSGFLGTVAGALGALAHLAIYIRREWHMMAPILVWIYLLLPLVLFYIFHSSLFQLDARTSLKYTSVFIISYCSGLFGSIVLYRLYFHRLRSFTGPRAAAASKLWHVWKCRGGQNYLVIEDLHRKYGPIIRTGPEEITIIDPSVPLILDGPGNKCEKAAWYDFLLPEIALNTTRSKQNHDYQRRVWDRAFSTKAFDTYEQLVTEHAKTMAMRISQLSQKQEDIVVTDWFYWFTFDVIGELAFSKSFDMLRDQQWHFTVKMLRRAMTLLGPFSPVPWLAQIAFHIFPWAYLIRDWFNMIRWCRQRMDERVKAQLEFDKPDVAHWLIDESIKKNSLEADRNSLNGNAIALIIAGSDTVASALVFAAYELSRNPSSQDKLLEELQNVDVYDRRQLQRCEFLNAIINETLRIHPPVPTGGYRQSPPDGMTVNGTYIPGNVTIVSPRYSLGRLESCYEQARQWIPERWTTRPEMLKDVRGFSPFAQGRYNCVGKTLAMMEMRVVIASLVKQFKIGFSDTDPGEKVLSDLRDQFTAAPGKLQLKFEVRH